MLNAAVAANTVAAVSDANASGGTAEQAIGNLDDCTAVMEWRAYTSVIGANGSDQYMGLHSLDSFTATGVDDGTANSFVLFRRDGSGGGDTNWFIAFADNVAAGTPVDSGVAIAADTWYTFRIELHGANTPVGVDNSTAAVARCFIDGVEVAEITASTLPSGAEELGMLFFQGGTGGGAGPTSDVDLVVGHVKLAWNEVLSADVPA
jgi:hypothetical protein